MAPQESNSSYLHALKGAYTIIFEINLDRGTVECIHGRDTSKIGNLYDIHMTIESAKNFWLKNYILSEDRDSVSEYLDWITTPGAIAAEKRPLQSEFRFKWDDGITYTVLGVAIELNNSSILLCIRDITQVKFNALQAKEVVAIKKLYSHIEASQTASGASGSIIFSKAGDSYSLIYASESIRKSYDLSYEDYLHYCDGTLDASVFFPFPGVSPDDFERILAGNSVTIHLSGKPDTYTTSCSKVANGLSVDYTIVFFRTDDLPIPTYTIPETGIFARTFGHFDIFVDGSAVIFSSAKEKELLALLIDRNGGTLSSAEAIGYLWENVTCDEALRAKYRKLALGLRLTLEKYGIAHIIKCSRGVRSIDTSAIKCDYYDLLSGSKPARAAFHNTYMSGYPWAENTLASLWDYS